MKKKLLLMVVVILVLSTFIAACSTSEKQQAENEETDEKETLNISLALMGGPKTPNSWTEKSLEEDLTQHLDKRVEIENVFLPSWADLNTKVNLLMSDYDQMPDIMWFPSMDREFQTWVDGGIVVDLAPLLQKHGKNIINYYSKETLFYSWNTEGKIYRIPGDVAEAGSMTTILRKDWLENLNLETPTTLDEYIEVLRAFTQNDPDGNGKDDTYGLSGDNNYRSFTPFFYAYGVDPESFLIQEDGTVKFGATMPEVREVLEILQGLYKEGIIDPRMISSIDESKVDEILSTGKVGSMYRWIQYFNPDNPVQMSFKAFNPDGEYMQIDPVKGPDGFASDRPSEVNGWAYLSVTAAAEEPEEAVKVLDRMASPETYKLITFGKEGEHYEIVDGQYNSLIETDEMNELGLGNYNWYVSRKDEANIQNTKEVIEIYEQRAETSMPMREKIAYFKSNNRPMWNEYGTDITTLRDETFWGIISGSLPITAFDEFIEKFDTLGGKEIEEEANTLYSKQADEYNKFEDWYEENIEPFK